MPLQSSEVFASHIGHTGKTTLAFQLSTYFALKHPEASVLVTDFAEEGDLTKRLLGGVDAARNAESLYGGVLRLLNAMDKRPSGFLSWFYRNPFDVTEHAIEVATYNSALPANLYLISSGAWPRLEAPWEVSERMAISSQIKDSLEKSPRTWKLFCDTDGDRRPSPFTLLAYNLCDLAVVPCHLNKGDMDRTETMLGVLYELRSRGEIDTQVSFVVWNYVKILKHEPTMYRGTQLHFTPTKVCLDILDACNKRLYRNSLDLPGLFVHAGASEADFVNLSTFVLGQFADNVIKPSEELGLPVAAMMDRLTKSGKKTLQFASGGVSYDTRGETIESAMQNLTVLEEQFSAMSVG
eukprot:TRINITY_DN28709_c0_g1_i1.p1 TRINITY_DN28709_c0_g1~~TRINITY_DN28709_c0_g1_i1.p1  ORF type:complete len:352 (+),score=63.05 TRINITY_DN28709_c0_g1_i1:63-1118(+)